MLAHSAAPPFPSRPTLLGPAGGPVPRPDPQSAPDPVRCGKPLAGGDLRAKCCHIAAVALRKVTCGPHYPHRSFFPSRPQAASRGILPIKSLLGGCSLSGLMRTLALTGAHHGSALLPVTPRLCATRGFPPTRAGLRAAVRPCARPHSGPSALRITAQRFSFIHTFLYILSYCSGSGQPWR